MFDQNEIIEFNIGIDSSPKLVNIGKGTTHVERKYFLSLIIEFEDVFSWSYGDFKSYRIDVINKSIPLKEGEIFF
jgi:hypothetical protein